MGFWRFLLSQIDWSDFLTGVGVILGGALLFPLAFLLISAVLGFTSAMIVSGSMVALLWSFEHPVSTEILFAIVQPWSVLGLRLNRCFLTIELIIGMIAMVYLWFQYSYDMHRFCEDWSRGIHNTCVVFNYGLSIGVAMTVGVYAGLVIGRLILAFLSMISFLMCGCFKQRGSKSATSDVRQPLLPGPNGAKGVQQQRPPPRQPPSRPGVLPLFTVAGLAAGIMLGVSHPVTVLPW